MGVDPKGIYIMSFLDLLDINPSIPTSQGQLYTPLHPQDEVKPGPSKGTKVCPANYVYLSSHIFSQNHCLSCFIHCILQILNRVIPLNDITQFTPLAFKLIFLG